MQEIPAEKEFVCAVNLAEINRKAIKQIIRDEAKSKKAASSPPNRFKFKSVKRSLGNDNGETKMGPGAKKGKVAKRIKRILHFWKLKL